MSLSSFQKRAFVYQVTIFFSFHFNWSSKRNLLKIWHEINAYLHRKRKLGLKAKE